MFNAGNRIVNNRIYTVPSHLKFKLTIGKGLYYGKSKMYN